MAAKGNQLDVIFNAAGIKRANRRTKPCTFSEADVSSLLKDASDNRDNTGWPCGQHVVLTSAPLQENIQTILTNWKILTSKDSDQPSTQRLYVPVGEGQYQRYDAFSQPMGGPDVLQRILGLGASGARAGKCDKYLAAIRTKPFILLAGISGTGKSRMVRQLARGLCPRYKAGTTEDHPFYNEQKPGNFEIIPVRPNWHDSTELMGYESRIGSPEFIIKPFVEFLVKAWMNPDIPFFLCLDEMNLAPVEQYFAEYLSAIESRKAVNGGGRDYFKTDVVVKMGASEAAWDDHGNSVLHNALEKLFAPYKDANDKLDTWASHVREVFTKDGGVSIPQNLVVMGTVNMDETTCSFSRKVLDRAMSFELNDVSDMYAPDKLVGEGDYEFGSIAVAAAKCSLLTGKEAYDANAAVGGKVLEYLKIVNEALEGKKFKIAYRSRNEIMIYCVERTNGGIVGLRQALDEATNLKILSRIEGDDQTFASFDLKDFRKTIVKGLLAIDNPSVQDSDVDDFLKDEAKVRASPCASKLGHMIDELSHGAGVVSYWE